MRRDWDGKAMPRPPLRARQLLEPQAAYQMVHIMEGVVERGTATVLRDLDRPLFGKTGTTSGRPMSGSSAARPMSSPASISAMTGRARWAAMPRAAGSRRRCSSNSPRSRFKDAPKTPFVAPAGIRMVRIDRVSGKRVFGTFPTSEDPKSSVIWEAFQPETEPRRSFRREDRLAMSEDVADNAQSGPQAARPARAQAATPATPPAEDFLQRQGGIY